MRMRWIIGMILLTVLSGRSLYAQVPQQLLTLEESIRIALAQSLSVYNAVEGIAASEFRRKTTFTDFLPAWSGQYSFSRANPPLLVDTSSRGLTVKESRNAFNFNTSIDQPLYTGGRLSASYRIDKLGVDISRTTAEVTKMDVVLQVRTGYFNILNSTKLREVAQQAVKQVEAQLEVTKAFFEVGIQPKNDVLLAEVQLANARQVLARQENGVALAKSSFNTLLRRGINEPLDVVDILEYKPFPLSYEDCLQEALRERPEIRTDELSIMQAKEAVKVAKSGYYPIVNLTGTYSRSSEEAHLNGDIRNERWSYQTLASITFWEWGRTGYQVGESKVRLSQAEIARVQRIEGITLEVKNSYLNVQLAEKNISVSEKAIEQAEENLRMTEERYKYQVATQTEVLDAVTLLAQGKANYYTALSDYNIAKAELERAMGRMSP